ncbi:MAG TPA: aspartate carbamoyltransferase catalytic subunit [Arenimonas sp.]|uniref:aspartate carbamoyltransferase catalytic subunit n=1 Tax=Arenimonas sp. TaxID=1872635 RepID=UPI002BFE5168|nr:aspartate carbamoyltransferase catalytic subunit [Arenimonas sp.]HMB56994.1 aspartate carbamoyltransferase catalytic subunit [Arenimonas sp.]
MSDQPVAQLHPNGSLRHLLTLDGLPAETLSHLLDDAEALRPQALGGTALRQMLAGRTVCTLFFEPSTRTRSSFQLAAARLGADILGFDVMASSAKKGETELDTLRNLEAMGVDCFVVRHADNGTVATLAAGAHARTRFINAGDGRSAHPTQGLLDMLTLRQRKGRDFSKLRVLIVGDVKHSRVARSDIHALRTLGAGEIRVCGPASLLPEDDTLRGCRVTRNFDAALEGVDAIMMLRLQRERMEEGLVPSLEQYFRDYGLTPERVALAKPDAIVMHPGPMNRGVEIAPTVADGPASVILDQVSNGVAVRMAVLRAVLAG